MTFDYDVEEVLDCIPQTAYPVDVRRTFSGWRVSKYNSIQKKTPTIEATTFTQYCAQTDTWESQLLGSVVLEFSPEEIVEKICLSTFIACSNGSAMTNQASFGWILALPDETRLAHGAGPVDGHDLQSFRAEAQGMLSVVCLLSRLRKWTSSTAILSGILATDNSGLVDRAKAQTLIRYPVPNSTFQSDWDVVESIVVQVITAEMTVTYKHVKGYQDKDIPYAELPFLARLNVDADKLAGLYQKDHGSYRPIIPLSPTRPIALDLSG
jgi:hypothetical protein